MQPVRVGIIGCGVIAPTHAACYQQHSGKAVLSWACDLQPQRSAALAEKFAIPRTTTDYHEVLRSPEVDLVSVCTDHASHAAIVCAALAAGKHVLCEKALAHNAAGLDAMLRAAAARPELVFAGVFQHRRERINQVVRDIVRDGLLGTILTATVQARCWRSPEYYNGDAWRGTWGQEGGAVLINQAIHHVDLLQWIMGGVASVCGFYTNLAHVGVIETEDVVTAALTFRCGALGTVEATSASHIPWEPTLCFHGTEGSLELRNNCLIKLLCRDDAAKAAIEARIAACCEDNKPFGKIYYGAGHAAQISDVLEAVIERRQPFVTAVSAAETVDLVLAVYESQRRGAPVALKPRL